MPESVRRRSHPLLVAVLMAGVSCAHPPATTRPAATTAAPRELLGRFRDDYGNLYSISGAEWTQQPHGRFHIVEWHPAEGFLVARNDAANTSASGKWTRIDWMPLSAMTPYSWGFCLTAWKAESRDAARDTPPPDRATPRTGCGGHPFSRMRPESPS